jgi:dienelactone hydrolase
MRTSITLFFTLFSLSQSFCQIETNLFEYNKTEKSGIVVQRQELDSVTVFEKVVLDGFDSKIPFYYYTNKRNKENKYVFLLHGLGDSKEDWVYPSEPYLDWSRNTTSIKDSLLTLGYNILIPDAKYHGERSYELSFRSPQSLPPTISKNESDCELFENLMTSTVKDIRIIMDYIENSNTQTDHSFSVIGYSMGANIAIILSVSDDRISAVVACVPPINHPAKEIESFDWSEKVIQGQIDITPMKYASLQSSPILLLMGKKDYFYTQEEVTSFFENVSTKDKELIFFDSGHILPNEYKVDAIKWITDHNN